MCVYKKIIFGSLILLVISGCAIFKGKGELTHISFEYDSSTAINYGKNFSFQVFANYANGKTKNISSKSELKTEIIGANYAKEKISIGNYPTSFKDDVIIFKATYTLNDKVYKDSINIPFNYLGGVKLNFSGLIGQTGDDGLNGKTSLLFRNGKDGAEGFEGNIGGKGDDLSVFVWHENEHYALKVYNMVSEKSYFYKSSESTDYFNFYTNGGKGGSGGSGGTGGAGKDGVKTEKKVKLPGQGGDGGNGGNGGIGGQGGSVYVFIHPNAQNFKNKIKVYNIAGAGGNGGSAGAAGRAGKPLEGQNTPMAANSGVKGNTGNSGLIGDVISIEVQDFDIEDVKNN